MSFLRTAFTDQPSAPVKPRKEQIESDFAMLAGKVSYVRTYRTTDGGEFMPEAAAPVGVVPPSGSRPHARSDTQADATDPCVRNMLGFLLELYEPLSSSKRSMKPSSF